MARLLVLSLTLFVIALCPGGTLSYCPENYVEIHESCFLFLKDIHADWSGAVVVCENQGGGLAILDDCNVMREVIDYIHEKNLTAPVGYWLGASDIVEEGEWKWRDQTLVAMGAPFWGSISSEGLEPDGYEEENCAYIRNSDTFYFHDEDCSITTGLRPLCQREKSNGICPTPYIDFGESCFQFVDLYLDWEDSRTVCQAAGGDLAVVDNCTLIPELYNYAKSNPQWATEGGYWIGGSDAVNEGTWKWLDNSYMWMGAPFWGARAEGLEPSKPGGRQDCLTMWHDKSYYFNDFPCSNSTDVSILCQF